MDIAGLKKGAKMIPKQDPKIRKVYFVCALPSGNDKRFKRYAYFSVDTSIDLIILHYVGDESIVIDFPHGNSHHCQPYYRTCPSVLENLRIAWIVQGMYTKKLWHQTISEL